MFTPPEGRLCSVGMGGEEFGKQSRIHLAPVVGEADVVFLVHGLQFGVEAADDHVLEAVALHFRPCVYFVGRDVLHITGDIIVGIGVRALAADGSHHLVVLVGDVVAGCQLRDGVNLVIPLLACLGVGDVAVLFEAGLDGVEVRAFSLGIRRAEVCRALEHKMFEVVCQTRRLLRVVA